MNSQIWLKQLAIDNHEFLGRVNFYVQTFLCRNDELSTLSIICDAYHIFSEIMLYHIGFGPPQMFFSLHNKLNQD